MTQLLPNTLLAPPHPPLLHTIIRLPTASLLIDEVVSCRRRLLPSNHPLTLESECLQVEIRGKGGRQVWGVGGSACG